jgi:hypothetical protein
MADIKKYHIRANITANFSGIRKDDELSSKRTVSELLDLLNTEVSSFQRIEPYERKYQVVGDEYIYFPTLYGVLVKNNSTVYRTNLIDAYINDIHLSELGKDGSYIFGKLEGTITATIEKQIDKTAFPEILKTDPNSESQLQAFTNNTSGTLTDIDSLGRPLKTLNNSTDIVDRRYFSFGSVMLWLTGLLLVGYFLLSFTKVFLVLLGIALVVFLVSLSLGAIRKALAILFFGICLIAVFSWIYSGLTSDSSSAHKYRQEDAAEEKTEIKKDDRTSDPRDSILVVHHRIWSDYDGNRYEGDIKINQVDYFSSKQFHNSLIGDETGNESTFWRGVYGGLSQFDRDKLSYTYQLFDSIGKANNLGQADFATMIVSCVQDIPYTLIANTDCDEYKLENPQDIAIINQTSCFGPIKYGVQAPNEFLYNLKGDCDTRTLLCYTILSHYGYDVAILNSSAYRHSILGVNMAASGVSKEYNGVQYFLWETTAKNCVPGFIVPDFNNLDYWEFLLVSK